MTAGRCLHSPGGDDAGGENAAPIWLNVTVPDVTKVKPAQRRGPVLLLAVLLVAWCCISAEAAESDQAAATEAGWWTMDFTFRKHPYRLLFHRQESGIHRIRIEQTLYRRGVLVCEFFEEPGRAEAQRFDLANGQFAGTLSNLGEFRSLSTAIVNSGASKPTSWPQKFWSRDDPQIAVLAKTALRSCLKKANPKPSSQ